MIDHYQQYEVTEGVTYKIKGDNGGGNINCGVGHDRLIYLTVETVG
jgi:hypothetical protein